jgi:chitinase
MTVDGNITWTMKYFWPLLVGPQRIDTLHIEHMDPSFGFGNFVAYDYAGSTHPEWAGHQPSMYSGPSQRSTLFKTEEAVESYLKRSVMGSKIVIGMPLYGRIFTDTDGLGEPFHGAGEGSWEKGVWDYKALPRPGAEEHSDENIIPSYSYDARGRIIVGYDNPRLPGKRRSISHRKDWELLCGG